MPFCIKLVELCNLLGLPIQDQHSIFSYLFNARVYFLLHLQSEQLFTIPRLAYSILAKFLCRKHFIILA